MSKFKMPSTESFRKNIESIGLPKQEKEAILKVLDYSAAHPSSLAEKQAQTRKAEAERNGTAKKIS